MKSVLLLDDDTDEYFILLDALEFVDFPLTLSHVTDVETAFQIITDNIPDLILVDINLPRINGFGFIRMVNENGRFKNLPIIIYSGMTDSSIAGTALLAGATGFIQKSSSVHTTAKDLENILHKLFGKADIGIL